MASDWLAVLIAASKAFLLASLIPASLQFLAHLLSCAWILLNCFLAGYFNEIVVYSLLSIHI